MGTGESIDRPLRTRGPVSVPPRLRLSGELAFVCALALVLYVIAVNSGIVFTLPTRPAHLLLILATAGGAAAAAILAGQLARLTHRQGECTALAFIAAGLATYGVVVMPFNAALFAARTTVPGLEVGRIAGCVAVLGLVAVGLSGRDVRWLQRWRGLALAAGISVGFAIAAGYRSSLAADLVESPWVAGSVHAALVAVATAFVLVGLWRGHALTCRIGIGLAVIGTGQLLSMIPGLSWQQTVYTAPALQLLGIAVFVSSLAWRLRVVTTAMHRRQAEIASRTRESMRKLWVSEERTAVRDHEIRNLVAGLSGVSQLLGRRAASDDTARELGAALQGELRRLQTLLDGDADAEQRHAHISTVLGRLVLLHRANGMRIDLDVEQDASAAVPPSTLAQVVTNLLANCARHAPNSQVRIRAHSHDDTVRVEVHDDGPGIPAAAAASRSTGRGVGLAECQELLAASGGALRLENSEAMSGALATVELPSTVAAWSPS